MESVNSYVVTKHEGLLAFAEASIRYASEAYLADLAEVVEANIALRGKTETYVALGTSWNESLILSGTAKAISDAISEASHKRNRDYGQRAIVALIHGHNPEGCTLKVMAEKGLEVLETAKNGGFVDGYEPASRRKSILKRKGINPVTGLPMTEAEIVAYAKAEAEEIAEAEEKAEADKLAESVAGTKALDEIHAEEIEEIETEHAEEMAALQLKVDVAQIDVAPDQADLLERMVEAVNNETGTVKADFVALVAEAIALFG